MFRRRCESAPGQSPPKRLAGDLPLRCQRRGARYDSRVGAQRRVGVRSCGRQHPCVLGVRPRPLLGDNRQAVAGRLSARKKITRVFSRRSIRAGYGARHLNTGSIRVSRVLPAQRLDGRIHRLIFLRALTPLQRRPVEDDLAAGPRTDCRKRLFEVWRGKLVCDHGGDTQPAAQHRRDFVPGFKHLATVDPFEGKAFENDLVPIDGTRLGEKAE